MKDHHVAIRDQFAIAQHIGPNSKVKGFPGMKLYVESQECDVIFTADAPPELANYDTVRITYKKAGPIPDPVVKRGHSWAHRNNFLHSFFKPMYH